MAENYKLLYGQVKYMLDKYQNELIPTWREILYRQWISVEDRLPEKDGKYITSDSHGNIHIFPFSTTPHVPPFYISENDSRYYPVTHWMPLPEPPKENEDD